MAGLCIDVVSREEALVLVAGLPRLRTRQAHDVAFVVDELVSNGLRGVPVTLSLEDDGRGVAVTVWSAPGPAVPACREAVLRAEASGGAPRDGGDGAGLGLYLVARRAAALAIADLRDGRVRAWAWVPHDPRAVAPEPPGGEVVEEVRWSR